MTFKKSFLSSNNTDVQNILRKEEEEKEEEVACMEIITGKAGAKESRRSILVSDPNLFRETNLKQFSDHGDEEQGDVSSQLKQAVMFSPLVRSDHSDEGQVDVSSQLNQADRLSSPDRLTEFKNSAGEEEKDEIKVEVSIGVPSSPLYAESEDTVQIDAANRSSEVCTSTENATA